MNQNSADKLKAFIATQEQNAKLEVSAADVQKATLLALLSALGGENVTEDSLLFEGKKFVLPEQYEGNVPGAVEFLERYQQMQRQTFSFNRTFDYRPKDGARSFNNVLKNIFGNEGLGKATPATFFSPERPPQTISINTGLETVEQIPWGLVEFPMLEATFNVTAMRDREKGMLFHLNVEAPKRYRRQIEAFFKLVAEDLKKNSIYKGKAITGAEDPTFLDTASIDPKKVVYSEDVMTQLDNNLFGRIRHAESMKKLGIPVKRAVLVEGPYGTGKTLAGMLTAQTAEQNGWTFIMCRPGQDNMFEVLETARLYSPSVVWVEDLDVIASGGSPEDISKLLDKLDGIQGKGSEVIAAFTTNFVENLQKGVLRPGRIDAIIHIGALDAPGYEKLVNNLIKPQHLGSIDYELVRKAFDGFMPAFVSEAIRSSLAYALTRLNGDATNIQITTDDLINAALGLRRQLDLMNGANEGQNADTVDSVLRKQMVEVLNKTRFEDDKNLNSGLFVDEDRVVAPE